MYEHYAEREPASSWYRVQTRQAMRFGTRWILIALAALIWPLLVSFFIGSTVGVIIIYSLALVLDVALFVIWLRLALRYSRLAARGESFTA